MSDLLFIITISCVLIALSIYHSVLFFGTSSTDSALKVEGAETSSTSKYVKLLVSSPNDSTNPLYLVIQDEKLKVYLLTYGSTVERLTTDISTILDNAVKEEAPMRVSMFFYSRIMAFVVQALRETHHQNALLFTNISIDETLSREEKKRFKLFFEIETVFYNDLNSHLKKMEEFIESHFPPEEVANLKTHFKTPATLAECLLEEQELKLLLEQQQKQQNLSDVFDSFF